MQGITALQAQQQGHRSEKEEVERHQQNRVEDLADNAAQPLAEGVEGPVSRRDKKSQNQDEAGQAQMMRARS